MITLVTTTHVAYVMYFIPINYSILTLYLFNYWFLSHFCSLKQLNEGVIDFKLFVTQ